MAVTAREAAGRYDFVVLGAGLAGLSVARELLKVDPSHRVAVVEQESRPGKHSSGRSAGMVRLAAEEPSITPLAREGRRVIAQAAADRTLAWGAVDFERVGSVLLGADRLAENRFEPGEVEEWGARELRAACPFLGDASGEVRALWTPDDGRLRVESWIQRLYDEIIDRGADLILSRRGVSPILGGEAVTGLRCDDRPILTDSLVICTGAWAGSWARTPSGSWARTPSGSWAGNPSGAPSGTRPDARGDEPSRVDWAIQLDPRRRHVIETEPWAAPSVTGDGNRGSASTAMAPRQNDQPWVWDLDRGFYLRPGDSSIWWSGCDEFSEEAGEPSVDRRAEDWLREKLPARFPRLSMPPVTRIWSGHRTFAPDGRFLLGPDPRIQGWHWAVGLGGHGVTVSAAVGRLVAETACGVADSSTRKMIEPHLFRDCVLPRASRRATEIRHS